MKKKIMTIDDLYKFCEEQNFTDFDSVQNGFQLYVSTPAKFESLYESDEEDDGMMLIANVMAFHTNTNNNKSNVTKKAMEKSLSTFAYKPVLCNFQTIVLDDGTEDLDFTGHDMEIDDDGNIIYLEKQVGCFTSDKPVMEYDEQNDRYYACAKVAIPKGYTPAADVIKRKGGTDVSVELAVNKMSYDAKKKELLLEDIEVSALTLLGQDHHPGMAGAKLQIEDFSVKSEYVQNTELIEALNRLNKNLEEFQINNAERKEEKPMNKFEELLGLYGKTIEDVTFEYEGLSDEELETAFKEAFDDEDPNASDSETDPEITDNNSTEGENADPEATDGTAIIDDTSAPKKRQNNEIQFSAVVNGEIKDFSISLIDKLNALRDLVNNTYSESDDCWYDVDAYDEDKYVIMHDYWRNKHYRQSYAVRQDVYSLKGDRVEVFAQYLTQDEINSLSTMKSNYEQITNDLAQYQKKELASSGDYSAIADKEEFTQIVADVNAGTNEMTFEELKNTLDKMLLNYAKKGELNFEEVEGKAEEAKKSIVKKVGLMSSNNTKNGIKKSRYGNLFKK